MEASFTPSPNPRSVLGDASAGGIHVPDMASAFRSFKQSPNQHRSIGANYIIWRRPCLLLSKSSKFDGVYPLPITDPLPVGYMIKQLLHKFCH